MRGIPAATVHALPPQSRALVASLKRSADPMALLRGAPDPHVMRVLADALSDDCLSATLVLLADDADDPTPEQLDAALATVLETFDVATVRVMLASVAVTDAKAANLCDALLVDDARFVLDTAPARVTTTREPKQKASDEVRKRRRARREAERERKARERARPTPPPRRRTRSERPPPAPNEITCDVPITTRRAPVYTPQQARRFDATHELVGTVLLAEVRFDSIDPTNPALDRKHRPCVVVGVAEDSLLVRPAYSDGGLQSRKWQTHQLRDWRDAGLDRPSWIETKPHVVSRHTAHHEFGRLSDDDWNALW